MSVHLLSSISPILNNNNYERGYCLKSQIQNVHSSSIHHPFTSTHILMYRKPYKYKYLVNRHGLEAKSGVETDDPEITYDFDWGDEDEDNDGSPWEGCIVYRRNASISHIEYCTTLETLGLSKISSSLSTSTASKMGLRVTKDVKDYLDGTPVLVSIDVTRKKRKIRLDGIIKTVIALSCYRCAEAAAESVYSNFSLLLTEEPVEEPDTINFGTMYGDEKTKSTGWKGEDEEDEDDALIDIEDRLYFPPEEKEIDISKQIRDLIHLEITINAVCDSGCKGLCLQCGTNLNTRTCRCGKQGTGDVGSRPLGGLREKMKQK